jgi:hypothetical protein
MLKVKELAAMTALILLVSACAKKSEAPLQPVPPEQKENTNVGPFTMEFSNSGAYNSQFEIDIAQNEGKVEYYTLVNERGVLSVKDFQLSVASCPATQPQLELWWLPDSSVRQAFIALKGLSLTVAPGKKGLLMVSLRELQGCTRVSFNLNVERRNSNAAPEHMLGDWNHNMDFGGGFRSEIKLSFTSVADVTTVSYWTNCGSSQESFTGKVENIKTTNPLTFSVKILNVTREFSGACDNVLGLWSGDVGRFMNCLATRTANKAQFELACYLRSTATDYPRDFASGDIYWKK